MPIIDFWFSIGSTYTYLSVMRIEQVEKQTGVRFVWKPFNVRVVMIEMNNVPFVNKPAKAAYMWRDIERRSQMRGLSPKLPAPYPLAELERANRVAIVGAAEGWCPAYVRASYRRWIEEGLPAGNEPNISQSITEAGADVEDVLARADAEEAVAGLVDATNQAKSLGIFGSPTFVVGKEIFWGDDRLEDAISWKNRQGK
ncbi:2-hydroxychromene-2-carboxylate isomerase [Mesorhizobium sp. M0074]|uniref:2-hydroxychromene-2-carboxylate isomerase n=1 Tax=unclassified Mesorhizobium TaxID=325217 RepID=UPI0003CF6244|nr:2-hydroxychromene-2-carboxylate isomerase [Mesorhizobium sp. LSJC280B00]ESW76737.1 2-hydroxychromene-2-carboxylate isomerase [Mesorhizobium sp. LSJC280B00]